MVGIRPGSDDSIYLKSNVNKQQLKYDVLFLLGFVFTKFLHHRHHLLPGFQAAGIHGADWLSRLGLGQQLTGVLCDAEQNVAQGLQARVFDVQRFEEHWFKLNPTKVGKTFQLANMFF